MDADCDLEVDVNGEEIFFVNKNIISSYCGKIRNLFSKSKGITTNLKVILHDFPGGPESFELISRFCYNNGTIVINHFNAQRLFYAANYLEMNETINGSPNLLEQTTKSIEEIKFWSWPELLSALKTSQDLVPGSGCSHILEKCLDSVVARLVYTCETSPSCPSSSSPESSTLRLSTDSKSTESLRSGFLRSTWWFEDLTLVLTPNLIKSLVASIILHKFDHGVTSRFLFYYQKSRFLDANTHEKREVIEAIIDGLSLLDQTSVSYKSLFGMLRSALNLNVKKAHMNVLDRMIGSRLDQASLDNLLIASAHGSSCGLYDVNLVLQFVKYFLTTNSEPVVPVSKLKKVARLLDSYLAEVAPDPRLKPSKFVALVTALPGSARDLCDDVYHAIDIYLQVHTGWLSDEEKSSIFNSLEYTKLSSETCNHLTQNHKFPTKFATLALKAQQAKLQSLFHGLDIQKQRFVLLPHGLVATETKDEDVHEQVVTYAQQVVPYEGGKEDIVCENERMKEHLEGMQWRVVELEKVCRKMQTQMTKILKSKLSRQASSSKSLPRFCS